MNKVRENVMNGMMPYIDFSKHKELIAFTVGADYFAYDYTTDTDIEADFCEVIVAVEKDWLFEIMKKDDIKNPFEYLQEEYTWDDSIYWFNEAKVKGKIAVIEFN